MPRIHTDEPYTYGVESLEDRLNRLEEEAKMASDAAEAEMNQLIMDGKATEQDFDKYLDIQCNILENFSKQLIQRPG